MVMSMLEKPLIAFIKRACELPDPHPVVVKTKTRPKMDRPVARGASFQVTLRSCGELFVGSYVRTDAPQNQESC
jgi:hypothetical protein